MSKYGIKVVQVPLDIPEPRSDDVEEIAKEKVRYAFNEIGKPCVALDAGFYIGSLNGFPKAFVNFALSTMASKVYSDCSTERAGMRIELSPISRDIWDDTFA
jgi:inosine/xanthosine triphosphate pyrophosphatase family protein